MQTRATLRTEIEALRRHLEHHRGGNLAAAQRLLDRAEEWLKAEGLTAAEALARGDVPAEIGPDALAILARVEEGLRESRRNLVQRHLTLAEVKVAEFTAAEFAVGSLRDAAEHWRQTAERLRAELASF